MNESFDSFACDRCGEPPAEDPEAGGLRAAHAESCPILRVSRAVRAALGPGREFAGESITSPPPPEDVLTPSAVCELIREHADGDEELAEDVADYLELEVHGERVKVTDLDVYLLSRHR